MKSKIKKPTKDLFLQLSPLNEWQLYDGDFMFKSLKLLEKKVVCEAYFQKILSVFYFI